jgi:hypothetical protein
MTAECLSWPEHGGHLASVDRHLIYVAPSVVRVDPVEIGGKQPSGGHFAAF